MPNPSIPVDSSNCAYITQGDLILTADVPGSVILYTVDGSQPADSVGGSTMQFDSNSPIHLENTGATLITVKVKTVVGTYGTPDFKTSSVRIFYYYVNPTSLAIDNIGYMKNGSRTNFNSYHTYCDELYNLVLYLQNEYVPSIAKYVSRVDYEIKNSSDSNWITLGSVSGTTDPH